MTTLALLVTVAACGDTRGGEGTPSAATAGAAASVRTAPTELPAR